MNETDEFSTLKCFVLRLISIQERPNKYKLSLNLMQDQLQKQTS